MKFAGITSGLDLRQFEEARSGMLGVVMRVKIVRVQLEPVGGNFDPTIHLSRSLIWEEDALELDGLSTDGE